MTTPGDGQREQARQLVGELLRLAEVIAPVAVLGKAMAAGGRLAAALGDGRSAAKLDGARRRAAQSIITTTQSHLRDAVRSCRWLRQSSLTEQLEPDQARQLQRLVQTLSERRNLRALLVQVVDALLLWTGAERGLLLLHDRDGQLAVRAARNVDRDDLHEQQLTISKSLAMRALESGEPVVAVDAIAELSSSHASVHALGLRSVLALPLSARGEVVGVAYLDDRVRRGAFGQRELAWARAVAPIAALAIADASTQAQLRRAIHRSERMSRQLEQTLAQKETALEVAERELARAVEARKTRFVYDEIVGESEAIRQVLRLVDRVSVAEVPVLLQGESGSGKELLARALHRHSARADYPFVSENCGALPETLLESTLFGHVRGAFTGAIRPRVGLFETADGGTLFLDEISEMSLGMQTKLLRVLENGIVRPLGSEKVRKVDVRILAATNRKLTERVTAGAFREDLFYRLDVVTIQIPPLRQRRCDIPLLVQHFVDKHNQGDAVRFTAAATRALRRYSWPGNVRQLENEIRRALVLCDAVIDADDLSFETEQSDEPDVGMNLRARVDGLENKLVREALKRTGGNQTHAAELLGVSRFGLHKMMKRLGIRTERGRKRSKRSGASD